jgi:negative regulator of flagellin synthesis FlgM
MTERINGQGFRPADAAGARRTDAAKPRSEGSGAESAAPQAASTADRVNFTSAGLLMSKLEEIVQNTAAVDSERVSAIKEALASGTYEIDDQAVADKLLRFDRELVA